MARLEQRFSVRRTPISLGRHKLLLPEFEAPAVYLEQRMRTKDSTLPYWTRIWPASVALATFVTTRHSTLREPILELGAGLGLPGLVAALEGSHVVLTDSDADALDFARAAVELNALESLVQVRSLDWAHPPDDFERFGTVLGSEILYHESVYPTLLDLLDRVLARGGTAYLSHEQRPFDIKFLRLARERFSLHSTSCTLRSASHEQGATKVFLHAIRRSGNGKSRSPASDN